MNPRSAQFDEMFVVSDDPWGYRTRWYELRKRELLLASLSRQKYRRALELGSANGEVTARLANRAAQVVACDISERAIELTRQRVGDTGDVTLLHGALPRCWPPGEFDLVVLNELGYYLSDEERLETFDLVGAHLSVPGELVVCHWRYPIEDSYASGDDVHAQLTSWALAHGLLRVTSHLEPDFLLDVWSNAGASVAAREGLR